MNSLVIQVKSEKQKSTHQMHSMLLVDIKNEVRVKFFYNKDSTKIITLKLIFKTTKHW